LGYAVGVKEVVDLSEVDIITAFMNSNAGTLIDLQDGRSARVIKGDVKIRNGKAVLIYRYQLIQ
jgi:hypothetical protein